LSSAEILHVKQLELWKVCVGELFKEVDKLKKATASKVFAEAESMATTTAASGLPPTPPKAATPRTPLFGSVGSFRSPSSIPVGGFKDSPAWSTSKISLNTPSKFNVLSPHARFTPGSLSAAQRPPQLPSPQLPDNKMSLSKEEEMACTSLLDQQATMIDDLKRKIEVLQRRVAAAKQRPSAQL
jgi:hypothetical protein